MVAHNQKAPSFPMLIMVEIDVTGSSLIRIANAG